VVAGFIALLVVGLFLDGGWFQPIRSNRRKETLMDKAQKALRAVGFVTLRTVWAIGTSAIAVPLSA
jgi:hypothetical protein